MAPEILDGTCNTQHGAAADMYSAGLVMNHWYATFPFTFTHTHTHTHSLSFLFNSTYLSLFSVFLWFVLLCSCVQLRPLLPPTHDQRLSTVLRRGDISIGLALACELAASLLNDKPARRPAAHGRTDDTRSLRPLLRRRHLRCLQLLQLVQRCWASDGKEANSRRFRARD